MNRKLLSFVLTIACLTGCGPRIEVMQEKVLGQIDHWLGELEVKRKQVGHAIVACQQSLDIVIREKVRVQVQLELLDTRIATLIARETQVDDQLKRIKGELAKGSPQGTPVSESGDLRLEAQRLLRERQLLNEQSVSFKATHATLAKATQSLRERQQSLQPRLDQYRVRLDEIDTKRTCLKALQNVSATTSAFDTTLASRWNELESQLNELSAGVETEIRFEDEKWSQFEHASKGNSDLQSVESILADIESIEKQ